MNITQSNFGKLSDGREIAAYTLKNTAGNSVKVITYGARLVAWEFGDVDVVLGYADAATYERDNKFMGAVVGRFANRIDRAQFCLNDHMYALDQNDGNNHLHGGFNGFTKKFGKPKSKMTD